MAGDDETVELTSTASHVVDHQRCDFAVLIVGLDSRRSLIQLVHGENDIGQVKLLRGCADDVCDSPAAVRIQHQDSPMPLTHHDQYLPVQFPAFRPTAPACGGCVEPPALSWGSIAASPSRWTTLTRRGTWARAGAPPSSWAGPAPPRGGLPSGKDLEEMFTLRRLGGLRGLARILTNTNCIESRSSGPHHDGAVVKRWRTDRWTSGERPRNARGRGERRRLKGVHREARPGRCRSHRHTGSVGRLGRTMRERRERAGP